MQEWEDHYLAERGAAGDRDAFATLAGRYLEPLWTLIRYRVGNWAEAEDVLQDTLLLAWLRLPQLRAPADATRMNAVWPALVHGVAGVEIEVDEWEDGVWHSPAWLMYGRLANDSVQWLACLRRRGRQGTLETFLDEGFAAVWGESPRRIAAGRRFVEQAAGILKQTADEPAAAGLGFYRVAVGGAAHDCLRVIELEGLPSEDGILMEAFINRDGRTVLLRRYNGRLWAGVGTKKTEWDRELPDNQVLVVDGVKYVHWYDCVTDAAIS